MTNVPLPQGVTQQQVERLLSKKTPRVSSQGQFTELGRLQTTDSTQIVLSQVYRDGSCQGLSISKFITTDKYTGFGKGVYIPLADSPDFLHLFPKDDLQDAVDTYPEAVQS